MGVGRRAEEQRTGRDRALKNKAQSTAIARYSAKTPVDIDLRQKIL